MNEKIRQLLNDYKPDLIEIKDVVVTFIRHPLYEIQHLPDWHWKKLILFQILLSGFCAFLEGLLRLSVLSVLGGVFLRPIITLVTVSVATLFFYYIFQLFLKQTCSFRRIFTIIVFANIPFFIFEIVNRFIPFISILGLTFTFFLMVVGFTTSFQLPRKSVVRIVGGLYAFILLVWLWGQFDANKLERSWDPAKSQGPSVELGE